MIRVRQRNITESNGDLDSLVSRPTGNDTASLCEKFGFHAQWREALLALIGLDIYSAQQVRRLHERVLTATVAPQLIAQFFDQLLKHEQARELLSSFDQKRLEQQQIEHLKHFGENFREAEYFESRARIGVVHARVGLPLSLYLASFGVLQTLILDVISALHDEEEELRELGRLVLKLTTLDIALATEVYHRSQVQELDHSLQHLRLEPQLLRHQLEKDELTGVSSRTSLLSELDSAIKRASKTGQPLCVVMADLDYFKVVNDTHGHLVGDQVLAEIAARIRAALRQFDLVGRYGGEEFVLLLENTSPHTAHQIAERVRQRVCSEPVKVKQHSLPITISQGLSILEDGDNGVALLQRADQMMYQAKQAGRNCIAPEKKHVARR